MKIILGILIFSVIVIIHEFGHFLFAKLMGIGVEEFSIGLGPTLIGFKKHGTLFSIKAFPFGGMCRMVGEDPENSDGASNAFYSKNWFQRLLVCFAGPLFNFILAFLLSVIIIGKSGYDPAVAYDVPVGSPAYEAGIRSGDTFKRMDGSKVDFSRDMIYYFQFNTIKDKPIKVEYVRDGIKNQVTIEPVKNERFLLGVRYSAGENECILSDISEGSPASKAGMRNGDKIVSINGTKINSGSELAVYMSEHPLENKEVEIVYLREGAEHTVNVTPMLEISYITGLEDSFIPYRENAGFFGTLGYAFKEVGLQVRVTFSSLGGLFKGKIPVSDIGGPVAIVSAIGDVYTETNKTGDVWNVVYALLSITILLSANLGVMNLLPIPALDGGRIVFSVIEGITRRPVDKKIEGIVNFVGMIILLLLMFLILIKDVVNLFV